MITTYGREGSDEWATIEIEDDAETVRIMSGYAVKGEARMTGVCAEWSLTFIVATTKLVACENCGTPTDPADVREGVLADDDVWCVDCQFEV